MLNSLLFYSVLQFVKARQLKPVDICCLPVLFDCVTVPRRNFLSGTTVRASPAWHAESSFETGQSAPTVASTSRERSADVQDLGIWQVWQEQPASHLEMSNLELPRERSRPRRWWLLGLVVEASPILPHDRDAVHVELDVVGIRNNRGRAVASPSLRRVSLQLWWRRRPRRSMGGNRRPDDGNRPGCGPIGRGRTRAIAYSVGEPGCIHCSSNAGRGGDEDVCQIPQAKQEKRKQVQDQLSSLTQQAKEARDLKAKEREEVEVEARTAREGSAQITRNSSTRSSSPMSTAQWAAGLQNALDGEVKESFNLWLEQFVVQVYQFLPQQQPVQIRAEMLSHHSPCRSPQSGTISIGSADEDDSGRLFRPESRFQHIRT